jgi:hypothetical protein
MSSRRKDAISAKAIARMIKEGKHDVANMAQQAR